MSRFAVISSGLSPGEARKRIGAEAVRAVRRLDVA